MSLTTAGSFIRSVFPRFFGVLDHAVQKKKIYLLLSPNRCVGSEEGATHLRFFSFIFFATSFVATTDGKQQQQQQQQHDSKFLGGTGEQTAAAAAASWQRKKMSMPVLGTME